RAATPMMGSTIWCWLTLLSATLQILPLSCARQSVLQSQEARSSFTTATMHLVFLTPIHLNLTSRCLNSLFQRQTSMSCARFLAFCVTQMSKLPMRLVMSCSKSALENFSQALRKISALLQSELELSCKLNLISGLRGSTMHYPKTRSLHHVISSPTAWSKSAKSISAIAQRRHG